MRNVVTSCGKNQGQSPVSPESISFEEEKSEKKKQLVDFPRRTRK